MCEPDLFVEPGGRWLAGVLQDVDLIDPGGMLPEAPQGVLELVVVPLPDVRALRD